VTPLAIIKNLRFALMFRLCALLIAIAGVLKQIGVFDGKVSFKFFMYYTLQSNMLAIFLFALLVVRTVTGLRKGERGGAGWYTRFGMICAVDLLVTMIIFWVLLVPQGIGSSYLLTFENIALHTITPLLCLFDYILFSEAGRLKYQDVYYACIFPMLYWVLSTVAGLLGFVYGFSRAEIGFEVAPSRFPYFFIDFDKIGGMVPVYVAGILIFFLMLGHIMFFIDRKIRQKPETMTAES
jgi:hypothetical protein